MNACGTSWRAATPPLPNDATRTQISRTRHDAWPLLARDKPRIRSRRSRARPGHSSARCDARAKLGFLDPGPDAVPVALDDEIDTLAALPSDA
jgi:hypothetical protein